ncbi:hypothetical protein BGZ90_012753 [Linnemannia elongata]|nr:hypothetical protein BGZ90_012753 [Linnemannia elongata]
MDSAHDRFFNVEELLLMLGQFLPKSSVSRLMRTNKRFYRLYTPLLFRILGEDYPPKLPTTPNSLMVLAKNVRHVRSLEISGNFCTLYFSGLMAFQDLQDAALGIAYSRPNWVPMTYPRTSFVMPLTPLVHLTDLICSTGSTEKTASSALKESCRTGAFLAQLCYLIQQSPLLLKLILKNIPVNDDDDVRLLAKTVAALARLETLFLDISTSPQRRITNITPGIFFSCSPSLTLFRVDVDHQARRILLVVPPAHSNNSVEPFMLRQDPLPQLTVWHGSGADFMNADSICSILEHCGSIAHLEVPFVQEPQNYSRIAKCIADNCPHLKHLGDPRRYYDKPGEFVGKVLAAVAENSLESFYINGFEDDQPRLGPAILRHSGSLTSIEFFNCESVSSATILSILVSCVALKVFIVDETLGVSENIGLYLADVASQPWVLASLQILQLEIKIGDLDTLRNPLYSRPAPVVLTEEETGWMPQLGKFYHQIGVLKELEKLELKVAINGFPNIVNADMEDDDEDVVEYEVNAGDEGDDDNDLNSDADYFSYQDASFPGWLSLGNAGKGWPGYLETLAGLTKLKELKGSFGAMTRETRRTMGARELAWFADHLPMSEEVQFFREGVKRHSFRWLKKERPNLKMDT